MGLNDVFYDGETQTRSALFPASSLIYPVKPFKNAGKMFFIYAFPIVTYLNDHIVIKIIDGYKRRTIVAAIFNAIGHQVHKYLPDPEFIGFHKDGFVVFLGKLEPYVAFCGVELK